MAGQDLLQADAGVLETCGTNYISCGDDLSAILQRMRNDVNNLTASFQGSAAQAFYTKMDTLFQQMNTLCQEVSEMGNDLKTTASKVRQLQAEAEAILRD